MQINNMIKLYFSQNFVVNITMDNINSRVQELTIRLFALSGEGGHGNTGAVALLEFLTHAVEFVEAGMHLLDGEEGDDIAAQVKRFTASLELTKTLGGAHEAISSYALQHLSASSDAHAIESVNELLDHATAHNIKLVFAAQKQQTEAVTVEDEAEDSVAIFGTRSTVFDFIAQHETATTNIMLEAYCALSELLSTCKEILDSDDNAESYQEQLGIFVMKSMVLERCVRKLRHSIAQTVDNRLSNVTAVESQQEVLLR